MPARLIVNADDFGLTPGINRSVGELHRAGALTSATLMAGGLAFADALNIGRQCPALGVGCHLVFADGIAVCDPGAIPSLVEAKTLGFRRGLGSVARAALLGSITEDELVREGVAQVARLQTSGVVVTHLDTHKHTHMLPVVARSLVRIAEQCGVPAIRNPFEPAWAVALGHGGSYRSASVRLLSAGFRMAFDDLSRANPRIRTTSGTIGVAATGRLTRRALNEMLAALPASGTWELVVHPGYDDAELAATGTRLRASRDVERLALAEALPRAAVSRGCQLIQYGEL